MYLNSIFQNMKYWLFSPLLLMLLFCKNSAKQSDTLFESGIWVNYKYPYYLGVMNSARITQTQINITAVDFRQGDSLVWVQYRLHDWHPFKVSALGEKKWTLMQDTSNITISLELNYNGQSLSVARDMFTHEPGGDIFGTAFRFYSGLFHNGNGEKWVKIYDTGKIVGLDSFVAFKPIIDYSMEPGKGDRILLCTAGGTWYKFGLASSGTNSLEIYALNKNKLGKRIYHIYRPIKPIYL